MIKEIADFRERPGGEANKEVELRRQVWKCGGVVFDDNIGELKLEGLKD